VETSWKIPPSKCPPEVVPLPSYPALTVGVLVPGTASKTTPVDEVRSVTVGKAPGLVISEFATVE
jgi:hypothetical protein